MENIINYTKNLSIFNDKIKYKNLPLRIIHDLNTEEIDFYFGTFVASIELLEDKRILVTRHDGVAISSETTNYNKIFEVPIQTILEDLRDFIFFKTA